MFLLTRLSRQKPTSISNLFTRHLSSADAASTSSYSKLRDHYSFVAPASLSPTPQNPNPNPTKKKPKPKYRPPSSLEVQRKLRSDLPFDFRYSYTESSPAVRPIGLREPKFSPFGPGRLDREWTGVCAPAVSPKAKSVDEDGVEDPKLEEKRRTMRARIQGAPLTNAERKALVDKCHRSRTKKQVQLGIHLSSKVPIFYWICNDLYLCFDNQMLIFLSSYRIVEVELEELFRAVGCLRIVELMLEKACYCC